MTLGSIAALGLLLAAPPTGLSAKTFALPDAKPVVAIDLPDGWAPEVIEKGAQATSPDASVYVAFRVADARDTDRAIADAVTFFAASGIRIDPATQKRLDAKLNGMDLIDVTWDGVDTNGPTKAALSVILVSDAKIGILTYRGSAAGEATYAEPLRAIVDSIRPVGR